MARLLDLSDELILEILLKLHPNQRVDCAPICQRINRLTWDALYWSQFLFPSILSNNSTTPKRSHTLMRELAQLTPKLIQLTESELREKARADAKVAVTILMHAELNQRYFKHCSMNPTVGLINLVHPHERIVLFVLKIFEANLIKDIRLLFNLILPHVEPTLYVLQHTKFWEALIKHYHPQSHLCLIQIKMKLIPEIGLDSRYAQEGVLEQNRQLMIKALQEKLDIQKESQSVRRLQVAH